MGNFCLIITLSGNRVVFVYITSELPVLECAMEAEREARHEGNANLF